jgi:hypothetical protein
MPTEDGEGLTSHTYKTPTLWIPHPIAFKGEWLRMRISFQEEIDTSNEPAGVKKEEYPEDLCDRMRQGKSSPVLIAANQVTLNAIVDSHSNETPIISRDKVPHARDRGTLTMTDTMPLGA